MLSTRYIWETQWVSSSHLTSHWGRWWTSPFSGSNNCGGETRPHLFLTCGVGGEAAAGEAARLLIPVLLQTSVYRERTFVTLDGKPSIHILSNPTPKRWHHSFCSSALRCCEMKAPCIIIFGRKFSHKKGNYRQKEVCQKQPSALTGAMTHYSWCNAIQMVGPQRQNSILRRSCGRLWSWATIWQKLFVRFH